MSAPERCLLVVTDNRFWLDRMGSNARILAMLQHLRTQGWKLQVAFLGHHYPVDTPCLERLDLQVCFSLPPRPMPEAAPALPAAPRRPGLRQRLRYGLRWLQALATQAQRPRPAQGWWREIALRAHAPRVQDHADPRHAAMLQQLLARQPVQVVLVEYIRLAWVAPLLPAGVLRVIDTHDVQHERQQRFHAAGEPHNLDISAAEEAQWLSQFDIVVAIQRRDQQLLQALLHKQPRPEVIAAMHPLPLREPVAPPPGAPALGFIGSAMAPNLHAARELVQVIWPALLASWPSARQPPRLLIIGSVCDALQGQPLPAQVELLGHVDSLEPVYAALSLVANPVRMGGGLKIKNVDALCRGKALVTTSVGAEGLEDGAGQAFRVEDDALAFARCAGELLSQPQARAALEQSAHAYARRNFEQSQVYAKLLQALARRVPAATSSPAGSG